MANNGIGESEESEHEMGAYELCIENPEKIYSELRHDCEMNIPTIHLYAFKKSEFIGMLTSQEANYGKEIAKNNLILSGGKEYFRMIDEASKNGFNG